MSGLSEEARALLESGRRNLSPTNQDRERIRRSLVMKAAAAGAAVGASAIAGTAKAGASGFVAFLLGPVGKIAASVVLVGVVASGGYFLTHQRRQTTEAVGTPTASAAVATGPSSVGPNNFRQENVGENSDPAQAELAAAPSSTGTSAPTQPVGGAASSGPGLSEEVARLREAQRAMRDGKPSKAIEALGADSGDQSLALEEEREAMKIFALCRMGRGPEAQESIARFASRWPQSLYAVRIQTACESHTPRN